ncbi:large ribosomal subunit protein bL19c isoform X2 [Ziziphus jujuba]|uniref:Large ribosomal subunit protein bL19c isoform X2 n=1 Tax=Ziziphus jujuba TaxID=326968 RepID=A0ABM4A3W6_ZIZJJ|nr:50S ribosomal protein L19, chloroplastic-like isoform X2 [Ziziphus jujuba var. spinosa]XP_060671424.1 large ribosomal subunit protein bL19c isoform X2 [Ziziphus jujuba]
MVLQGSVFWFFVQVHNVCLQTNASCQTETSTIYSNGLLSVSASLRNHLPQFVRCAPVLPPFPSRCITTVGNSVESASKDTSASISDVPPRIKFKRLDKTARHIMQILDKEAVGEVKAHREIPDIKPGYIVQLKVEVPDNKRRVSILKGIVIARRNAGLNTTFRIRRLVAGVGVESLFPLYSPNIKEIKVLDKKKVRRAKLYYLRDKMNALKKH